VDRLPAVCGLANGPGGRGEAGQPRASSVLRTDPKNLASPYIVHGSRYGGPTSNHSSSHPTCMASASQMYSSTLDQAWNGHAEYSMGTMEALVRKEGEQS
jgi:hypothetical protein